MGKIYVGQSALRFTLDTNLDAGYSLGDASNLRIYYRKPSGTEAYWAATYSGTGTEIYYDVASTDILDEAGNWSLWSYAEFATGVVIGEAVKQRVYAVGY